MCTITTKTLTQLRAEQKEADEVARLFPRGGDLAEAPSVVEMYMMHDERNMSDAGAGYHRTTW